MTGNGSWIPPPHTAEKAVIDAEPTMMTDDSLPAHLISDMPPKLETLLQSDKNLWLFNIKLDPYEKNDLADSHPEIVNKLLAKLASYNATAVPCRYPPVDPQSNPSLHGGVYGPWVT